MCVYGYVRVSTLKQKVERQIANIKKEYPNAVIIDESYTGTSYKKPIVLLSGVCYTLSTE